MHNYSTREHQWDCSITGLGLWCGRMLQVHILLRQGAGPTECLKAAFSAHVFLHMLDEENKQRDQKQTAGSASTSTSSSSTAASSSVTAVAATSISSAADAASAKSSSNGKGRWPWCRGKAQPEPAPYEVAAAQPLTGADLVRETWNKLAVALPWGQDPGSEYYRRLLERSKCAVDTLYSDFSRQAEKQGWKLQQTMLNPKESRVLRLTPLSA